MNNRLAQSAESPKCFGSAEDREWKWKKGEKKREKGKGRGLTLQECGGFSHVSLGFEDQAFPCQITPCALLLRLLLPPGVSALPGPPSSAIAFTGSSRALLPQPWSISPYLEEADGGCDTAVGEQQGAEL